MDPKLKADWVKALRSGEYEQARGRLQENGRFCCLGVLNRVMKRPMTYGFYSAAGISYDSGTALVRMNDNERKPFDKIADYIEANL